jgi:hypothetical protein
LTAPRQSLARSRERYSGLVIPEYLEDFYWIKMKLIPFNTNSYTSDNHFMVDDDDFDSVSKFKWRCKLTTTKKHLTQQYDVRRKATAEERKNGAPNEVLLHRFVMGVGLKYANKDEEVDHINRNPFDATKANLRICTKHTNQRNKGNNSKVGFGLWGATFNKKIKNDKKWQANFHIKGKTYMVGYFATELEAHTRAAARYEEITGNKPRITL